MWNRSIIKSGNQMSLEKITEYALEFQNFKEANYEFGKYSTSEIF